MLRIKKGDRVTIRSGKDKGKTGKVLKVSAEKRKVVVEGANLIKKHMRKRSESETGGIKEIPAAINISNVNLFCSHCNKNSRFGVKVLDDKSKIRICKRCKKAI